MDAGPHSDPERRDRAHVQVPLRTLAGSGRGRRLHRTAAGRMSAAAPAGRRGDAELRQSGPDSAALPVSRPASQAGAQAVADPAHARQVCFFVFFYFEYFCVFLLVVCIRILMKMVVT